jgi:hypothetical protein
VAALVRVFLAAGWSVSDLVYALDHARRRPASVFSSVAGRVQRPDDDRAASHTPRAAAIAGVSSTNATRSWAGPPSAPLAVAASGCIRSLSDCSSTSDNPRFWGAALPEIADWQRRSRSPRWTVAGERGPALAGERRTTLTLAVFFQPSEEPPREYLDHVVYAEEQMVPGLGCRAGELFET